MDFSRSAPAIDPDIFPHTPSRRFWSSSQYNVEAWYVDFDTGEWDVRSQASKYYVRCVRRGPVCAGDWEFERFHVETIHDSVHSTDYKVIEDRVTGLKWAYKQGSDLNWEAALKYCESLIYGYSETFDEWRLPNINELASLVDLSRKSRPMSSFPGMHAGMYWSSTSYVLPRHCTSTS